MHWGRCERVQRVIWVPKANAWEEILAQKARARHMSEACARPTSTPLNTDGLN